MEVGDKIYTYNSYNEAYYIYTITRLTKRFVFAMLDGESNAVEQKIPMGRVNGDSYALLTPEVIEKINKHKKQNILYNYLTSLRNVFRKINEEDMLAIIEIGRKYKGMEKD